MSPLFVPGPVDVAPEVLQAQSRAMIPHRSPEFEEIFHRCENKMRQIFRADQRVFIVASSGTGLHEAAVRNLVSGSMLSCVNGAFGQRWADVAKACGKQADLYEEDWQKPLSLEKIAALLKTKQYEAICLVHNETSTGLVNPVQEIAALVKSESPDTLICIDAVSSLSGAPIETKSWGLDLVLTSSQKCLALPPGLAFVSVSDRALEQAKKVEGRGWYFDFIRMEKHLNKDSTPATPAVSLIFALDVQTDRILSEGIEPRWQRHARLASLTQDWAASRGFELYAPAGYRSQTLTAVVHNGFDFKAANAFIMQRGMRMASGYGALKESVFRIGHMGEITEKNLESLFLALNEFMQA